MVVNNLLANDDSTLVLPLTLAELARRLNAQLIGQPDLHVNGVAPLDSARADQLAFLSNPHYLQQAIHSSAGAIIIGPNDLKKLPDNQQRNWLIAANPYACFARAAQLFFRIAQANKPRMPGRAASALIASTARVPASCYIGPFVSIAADVILGERVVLKGHIHIAESTVIGDDTLIYPHVSIYHGSKIGARCIIHSGAVIGADGFGFAPDFGAQGGSWVKIPQTGTVIIGEEVEIGANTAIDRGAMADTIIEQGCKLDNQIQIAHNVHIGAFTVIAGRAAIAGSTKIGRYCIIGGAANIAGHLTIADKVTISGGTSITKSIQQSGQFTSVFPFMPHHEWEKNAAVIRQLNKLRIRLRQLEMDLRKIAPVRHADEDSTIE